jgi:hypothetical protein
MDKRYMLPMLVVALAMSPSYAAAQYRGDCKSICAQVEPFARQSRGDQAFVAELQRLSKACQDCQMQSRWSPSPQAAPPQIKTLPRFDSAPPPQQSASGNFLSRILIDLGSLWQGPKIAGGQVLSSDVQQRNLQVQPSAYAVEKMLNDPWGKPAVATEPSQPSFDGTNLIGSQSLQQPTVRPAAPTVDSSQTQPKGCSINPLTYEFNCVSTFSPVK